MISNDWVYKAALPDSVTRHYATHDEYRFVCSFRDTLIILNVGNCTPWLLQNFFYPLRIDDDD